MKTLLTTTLCLGLLLTSGCATQSGQNKKTSFKQQLKELLGDGVIVIENADDMEGMMDNAVSLQRIDPVIPYAATHKVAPEYPELALEYGIEGYVIVEFTITKTGAVKDVKVIEAYPLGIFEAAALAAARQFRYTPQYINNKPVTTTGVLHKLVFQLAQDEYF